MEQTKQLLPSQIVCIDLEWLEVMEKRLFEWITSTNKAMSNYGRISIDFISELRNQLFPLTPLLEDVLVEYGTKAKSIEQIINSPIKTTKQ